MSKRGNPLLIDAACQQTSIDDKNLPCCKRCRVPGARTGYGTGSRAGQRERYRTANSVHPAYDRR